MFCGVQNLTPEEGNALHNLHNLSNKIDIQGDGLGRESFSSSFSLFL